jgi:hypothetical protein
MHGAPRSNVWRFLPATAEIAAVHQERDGKRDRDDEEDAREDLPVSEDAMFGVQALHGGLHHRLASVEHVVQRER